MQPLMLCAMFALAQADKPKPPASPVEQALATALKNHPDIKVAEAKLRLVQVELEQAKVNAVQEVTAAELKVQATKQALDGVEETLRMNLKLRDKGSVTELNVRASEAAVVQARGAILAAQQQLDAAKTQPGLRVIEARLALAAAEVEQARLQVTKTVTVSHSAVQINRECVDELSQALALVKKAGPHPLEAMRYNIELLQMKVHLGKAEAELAAAVGTSTKAEATGNGESGRALALRYAKALQDIKVVTPSGTVADKLRAMLDKPIKMDLNETDIHTALNQLFKAAAVEGVAIRGTTPFGPTGGYKDPPKTQSLTAEQPLVAWLQLMVDDFNASQRGINDDHKGKYDLYVREYGLVLVKVELAPEGAMSVSEFAKAVRAAAEEKKKSEPKR